MIPNHYLVEKIFSELLIIKFEVHSTNPFGNVVSYYNNFGTNNEAIPISIQYYSYNRFPQRV